MTCKNCGKELPRGTRFCPCCGTEHEQPPVRTQGEPAGSPLSEEPAESGKDCGSVPVSTPEMEDDKKDCVKCGEDIPEDSVLCSYCGSWQEKDAPQDMEGLQKKTVDRRAFIAMAVIAVLLVVALILVSGILSSLGDKSEAPRLLPDTESPADVPGDGLQTVSNGQSLLEPDYELMCPLEIEVQGERSYYLYLEYIGEPEDSYDSRQALVSSPEVEDMAFYVEAGNSAEVYVPIGDYFVYYASGYIWQGTEALFGEETECSVDKYTLSFYTDEESAYGYTLELWDDAEDNPDMESISPQDFPG